MDARKFFFVSLGILALTLAYHLGPSKTEAQGIGAFVSLTHDPVYDRMYALTTDGDLWAYRQGGIPVFLYMGNFRSGTVDVEGSSFGKTKTKYR